MEERYKLYGVLGSPYVAKLRAILRYRRIPFDYIPASFDWAPDFQLVRPELAHVNPRIVPILWFPSDSSHRVDSSVIAQDLEKLHQNRRIVPDDPGTAFLSHLLEDMGDEWLLKIAFLYRWGNEADRNFSNRAVMAELLGGGVSQDTILRASAQFRDRQISRMPLVGCTEENAPLIEEVYRRVLDAFTKFRTELPYLFGTRPSLGDFGLFGSLFTCRNDPTPGAVMQQRSPSTLDWIYALDEASGVEGKWLPPSEPVTEGVKDLLRIAGDTYLPFLKENAAAIARAEKTVNIRILGLPFRQATFKYQAKCLEWLRQDFAALKGEARDRTVRILEETNCLDALRP